MVSKDRSASASAQSSPKSVPSVTPAFPGQQYDWTLQTVFEMQKSVGELTQAVRNLTEQQRELAKKVDGISHKMYAAITILVLIGAILTFFSRGINDLAVHRIESAPQQQVLPPR